MHDGSFGYPVIGDLPETFPIQSLALTAPTECPVPASPYLVAEEAQCVTIQGDTIIIQMTLNDAPKPKARGTNVSFRQRCVKRSATAQIG